jgi:hypothetical protein
MQTQNNFNSKTADLPPSAKHSAKFCPLCNTLNHPLGRECFNCGWRGEFFAGNAVVPDPCARPLCSFLSDAYFSACWRKFKIWFSSRQKMTMPE